MERLSLLWWLLTVVIVLLPDLVGIAWNELTTYHTKKWVKAKQNMLQWLTFLMVMHVSSAHIRFHDPILRMPIGVSPFVPLVKGARFWVFLPTKALASHPRLIKYDMLVILVIVYSFILGVCAMDLISWLQLGGTWRRGDSWRSIHYELHVFLCIYISGIEIR